MNRWWWHPLVRYPVRVLVLGGGMAVLLMIVSAAVNYWTR